MAETLHAKCHNQNINNEGIIITLNQSLKDEVKPLMTFLIFGRS